LGLSSRVEAVTERYIVKACNGPPIRLIFVLGVILATEGVMDFTLGLLAAVALIIMTAVVVTIWELFERWEGRLDEGTTTRFPEGSD
jgi:hypothetical protein